MQQLSFLPPAPLSPVWPSSGLALIALDALLSGDVIDHPGFEADTGSWRLAAVVNDLRRLGWPIQSDVAPDTLHDGRPRTVARYSLSPETLAQLRGVHAA